MTSVKIITHNGSFHADDVFAVATLVLALGDVKYEIVRTRDHEIIEKADYVVDVGEIYDPNKNRFDHHQNGRAGERPNGVPYAAFGLVWKKFGLDICGDEEIVKKIDLKLVQSIDAHDNGFEYISTRVEGLYPYTIGHLISLDLPTYKEVSDFDSVFYKVLDLAVHILKREIKISKDLNEAFVTVEKFWNKGEDRRLLVLDEKLPWGEFVSQNKEILFIIYPKSDGTWSLRTARDDLNSFFSRKTLPTDWSGKRDQELISITGVSDAIFCHTGLFVAIAGSKEGALSLANLALEN